MFLSVIHSYLLLQLSLSQFNVFVSFSQNIILRALNFCLSLFPFWWPEIRFWTPPIPIQVFSWAELQEIKQVWEDGHFMGLIISQPNRKVALFTRCLLSCGSDALVGHFCRCSRSIHICQKLQKRRKTSDVDARARKWPIYSLGGRTGFKDWDSCQKSKSKSFARLLCSLLMFSLVVFKSFSTSLKSCLIIRIRWWSDQRRRSCIMLTQSIFSVSSKPQT